MQQNIDAIKRQMEEDPEAFKAKQEEQARAASSLSQRPASEKEEAKAEDAPEEQPADGQDGEEAKAEDDQPVEKKKREAIDKQVAFVEFKDSTEGQTLQSRIAEFRSQLKTNRETVKELSETLNKNKAEIDLLKTRIDRKEEERKIRMRDEQLRQTEDMFEDAAAEEIIDEEELVLLRNMKDLKKVYRDNFGKLKNHKMSYQENQTQIDLVKQQLINQFEIWYAQEFEVPGDDLVNAYNANISNEMDEGQKADSVFGGPAGIDEEQETYMRAKRKVATLARAKREEKRIGIATK